MQVLITKIVESTTTRKAGGFEWFFTPVLGALLLNRWLTGIVLGVGLIQLVFVAAGIYGWQCPIRATVGITCPGCGLTTAMTLMATGRWATAVETHAFAPIFFGVLALMIAGIVLPRPYLQKLSTTVAALECKTGITAIITLGMIFYWLLRNLVF